MKRFSLFLFLFAICTPAFAAPSSPQILKAEPGESSCRIEWVSSATAAGYNVYLKTGAGKYQRLNQAPITDTFVRLVDLINGQPYVFAVTAVGPDGTESPASAVPQAIPAGYSYHTLPVKGGKGAGNYVLFSTPFDHGAKSPKNVFSYLPPYRQSRWRVFSMDKTGYHEYDDIKAIEPGKGYWFISSTRADLFLSGKTAQGPVAIRLQPGWNLIGSPYLFPVEWRDVLLNNPQAETVIDAALWEFGDGGFAKMGTLLPFHGYMVYSAASGDVDLTIPPTPSLPKVFQEGPPTVRNGEGAHSVSSGWLLRLSARDGTFQDADNFIGWSPTEVAAPTAPEPPAWPQHLSLYFTRKSGEGKRFSSDLRQSTKKWTAVVEGGQNKVVTVSWKTVAGSPKTSLTDPSAKQVVDMNAVSSYTFTRDNAAPRTLIIIERR